MMMRCSKIGGCSSCRCHEATQWRTIAQDCFQWKNWRGRIFWSSSTNSSSSSSSQVLVARVRPFGFVEGAWQVWTDGMDWHSFGRSKEKMGFCQNYGVMWNNMRSYGKCWILNCEMRNTNRVCCQQSHETPLLSRRGERRVEALASFQRISG